MFQKTIFRFLGFFYKNFQKTGQPFTDQSWAEFQNNYKILNDTLTKLETLYPGASLENPQVLDDSLFSFNFEGGYANNRNEDRISIVLDLKKPGI